MSTKAATAPATQPEVKGWCPGGHRPMMSGDGLVVRVRPWLGVLTPDQAFGIAELAERYGNGSIEATSRANLQIRGVSGASFPYVLKGLDDLDLLDADAEAEARRNVILQPFPSPAGDVACTIADNLSQALRAGRCVGLPGKFGFVVDTGEIRHLASVSGDVRIEASGDVLIVRADGVPTGRSVNSESEAVEIVLAMVDWFLTSGGLGPDGRGRMRAHVSRHTLPRHLGGTAVPNPQGSPLTPGETETGTLVAAAFGQLTSDGLRALARAAPDRLVVTPFRMMYLPGVSAGALSACDGLITRADDPILRVAACTGAPGCPQGQAPTRDAARELAGSVPTGAFLHVSGCAKGCAHPGRAQMTLVARSGLFDLVRDGTPWDQPQRTGIAPADLRQIFET